jgi:hypothetical protein
MPRPLGVTLLVIGVLIIAGLGLARAGLALEQYEFLADILPFSPLYLVVSGLIEAGISLVVAGGLWWRPRWARRGALLYAAGFTIYYWLDRLLVAGDPPGINWPFSTGLNIILLIGVIWVLARPEAKIYFGVGDE